MVATLVGLPPAPQCLELFLLKAELLCALVMRSTLTKIVISSLEHEERSLL